MFKDERTFYLEQIEEDQEQLKELEHIIQAVHQSLLEDKDIQFVS